MSSRRLVLLCCLLSLQTATAVGRDAARPYREYLDQKRPLPKGWKIIRDEWSGDNVIRVIEKRLGVRPSRIRNTVVGFGDGTVQINLLELKTEADVDKVFQFLKRAHNGRETFIARHDTTLIELAKPTSARVALRAKLDLGISPTRQTWKLSFDACTIDTSQPIPPEKWMDWNLLFNECLLVEKPSGKRKGDKDAQAASPRIAELSKGFRFGGPLQLYGLQSNGKPVSYRVRPRAKKAKHPAGKEIALFDVGKTRDRGGLPSLRIEAIVTRLSDRPLPTKRVAEPGLIAATSTWPADDPELVALAKSLTRFEETERVRVESILRWVSNEHNLSMGGQRVGTRYGVKKALEQKFGRCWDFSDVFVTLCRAAKIPCRQVAGWVGGLGGHVWSEVLLADEGWWAVDATTGLGCGSDYVPITVSEDGAMPLLYTSMPQLELVR